MIISWNWLRDYVPLDVGVDEFARRVMMAGLNHELTSAVGDDFAITLEVTSNRSDCLGHLGIAREAGALFDVPVRIPAATPREGSEDVRAHVQVTIESPQLCYRYTARVIRGVKVGPSPEWLVRRLATLGVSTINNVVDITNYVLFECGQPLHAFDLAKLRGGRIIVREPRPGEWIEAINHKTYELDQRMCLIADTQGPVGLGGVMGGADSEVSSGTVDLLIEAAEFDPVAIRNTARSLNLHSDSSYRFERGVDPQGVDWASRRCCAMILELAGGSLARGVVDVGRTPPPPQPVTLRYKQLSRVLGISIDPGEARRILFALGCCEKTSGIDGLEVFPPSWRRDLTREIDLVEEVARVYGYEAIPEDSRVPMASTHPTKREQVLAKTRHVLTASGVDEAMTVSAVGDSWWGAFSPWTQCPPLRLSTPILRGADCLRQSLLPSLLGARHTNESLGNMDADLFEIAHGFWPRPSQLPVEELLLGLVVGGGFFAAKGILESVLRELHISERLTVRTCDHGLFRPDLSAELWLGEEKWGYLGELSREAEKLFDLRHGAASAEVRLAPLVERACLIPQYRESPQYPSMSRDVNLVVSMSVSWADIESTAWEVGGEQLESVCFLDDSFRDASRIGPGNKSVVFSLVFRDAAGTLTNPAADALRDRIVAACGERLGAHLRQ